MSRIIAPCCAVFILIIAPFVGQVPIDTAALLQPGSLDAQLFFEIRLPRVMLGLLAGGILALGGLLFQTLFRNPMSTPFTLGTASSATFFAALAILIGSAFVSLWAFVGALSSIALILLLARRRFLQGYTLLLLGIALSFFYSAALLLVYYLSDVQQNYEIMRFTMGSLDIVGFSKLGFLAAASLILLGVSYAYRLPLRLLGTEFDYAATKGINVKKTMLLLLGVVSLAVGATVSLTGPIGFVGLIVPHLMKILYKQPSDRLILPVFFYGGVFLVFCDLIARNVNGGSDLPVGIVTAFVGAPFFIYLLITRSHLR